MHCECREHQANEARSGLASMETAFMVCTWPYEEDRKEQAARKCDFIPGQISQL
jgi:hypothetical protein